MQARLESIYEKIEKLISTNLQLNEEKERLKLELELVQISQNELVNKKNELEAEKENLENKLNFYTLAPESLTKKEIKDKIDQYISEIDLCIKQLENI